MPRLYHLNNMLLEGASEKRIHNDWRAFFSIEALDYLITVSISVPKTQMRQWNPRRAGNTCWVSGLTVRRPDFLLRNWVMCTRVN